MAHNQHGSTNAAKRLHEPDWSKEVMAQVLRGNVQEMEKTERVSRLLYYSFALEDGVKLVDVSKSKFLLVATWPLNLNFVDLFEAAQPEMYPKIGTRSIAAATENVGALTNAASSEKHFSPDRITRALKPTNQL
jgi:hypothetical protein